MILSIMFNLIIILFYFLNFLFLILIRLFTFGFKKDDNIQTRIILDVIPFLKILYNQISTISYMKILQLKSNGISKIFLFLMFFTILQLTFI